jgi:osmotically-inducible protein OsmY
MAKKETMHSSAHYQNLNDRELKLSILDNLKNDARLDLEQLEISCRKGVVYLEGIIDKQAE